MRGGRTRLATPRAGGLLLLVLMTGWVEGAEPGRRTLIGEVLGRPVFRDDLRAPDRLEAELHRLFAQPVLAEYRRRHAASLTVTETQRDRAEAALRRRHGERMATEGPALRRDLAEVEARLSEPNLAPAQARRLRARASGLRGLLDPPYRDVAAFILRGWVLQRHLYDHYGGGRILWQQAGMEAFDAMQRWLQAQERAGRFAIYDAELRRSFYAYWTTQQHGAFLTDDPERIRREFLEPAWLGLLEGDATDGEAVVPGEDEVSGPAVGAHPLDR